MGHLLNSNIGNMMKKYIGLVGRDRGIREVTTIEEIAEPRFFNWDIDSSYEIPSMSGAAHCEVYEPFLAVKNLKVGITYNEKVNLMVFAGEDLYPQLETIEKLLSRKERTKLMKCHKDSQNGTDLNT
jgi:hypothetical protein